MQKHNDEKHILMKLFYFKLKVELAYRNHEPLRFFANGALIVTSVYILYV